MGMIENDWLPELEGEFQKPYYKELYAFVKSEYDSARSEEHTSELQSP